MHEEQRARAHQLLRERGVPRALFAHPDSVAWLTGFAPPVQTGPSPFLGGPPLVWYEDGEFKLIAMDGQIPLEVQAGIPVVVYRGYALEPVFSGPDNLAAALETVAGKPAAGKLGLEKYHLPLSLAGTLFGEREGPVGIDGWLASLRMVKSTDEIARLRRAFALSDAGHAAVRAALRLGVREIDLWAEIHAAVERAAGHRVPLGHDCVVGSRENNIGGWPGDLPVRAGDAIIVDLGARVDGYWSDSCATYFAGEPSTRGRSVYRTVQDALAFAISLIRPGVAAGEIDRQVRAFITRAGYPVYPHHTGHGVGVSPHEGPRLVPGSPVTLETGMVIMLEPGVYFPAELGVRLEDAVLVTAGGAEVLTHHDKGL